MPGRHQRVLNLPRIGQAGKQQRVVGDCVELDVDHPLRLRQRVAHRAVHLRHAAQRIAVLRLVFLAATEWPKTLIEAFAAMALAQRYPVPADRTSTRLNSSHSCASRMPSYA